jgi:anaerobic magnesium-protoporphyrin IX monomethyl ester cyclase
MKVFLANPPTSDRSRFTREGRCQQSEGVWTTVWPPLSLAESAAVLREAGFQVLAADAPSQGWGVPEFLKQLKQVRPELVVLATSTPSFPQDIETIREIRQILPETIIAAFGIHVSVLPDECFSAAPALDAIIRGEPEYSIKSLAEMVSQLPPCYLQGGIKGGSSLSEGSHSGVSSGGATNPIPSIPGISIRRNGTIEHGPDREFIIDLDSLPFPAWDLFPIQEYRLPFIGRPFLLVTTARGCPYPCTFCVAKSYYGQKVRRRSPERIVEEIRWIIKQFNVRDFFFWSESTTLGKEPMLALCEKVRTLTPKIQWVCNSRVDHVDDELLRTMRAAGCWMLSFGVESGDQGILDRSQKKQTVEQTREAVALAKKHRFQVAGHFVLGLPGETSETLNNTLKLALELDLDYAQFYCAAPWPGSDLYQEATQEGWLLNHDWCSFDQSHAILNYPHLSVQEIQDFRDRAVKAFYLRPKLILRTVSRLRRPSEAWRFLKAVRRYLTWI